MIWQSAKQQLNKYMYIQLRHRNIIHLTISAAYWKESHHLHPTKMSVKRNQSRKNLACSYSQCWVTLVQKASIGGSQPISRNIHCIWKFLNFIAINIIIIIIQYSRSWWLGIIWWKDLWLIWRHFWVWLCLTNLA